MKRKTLSYGFTLTEVLVSLLILSLALLGFNAMQLFAFQKTHHAFLTSIAESQLNGMDERLRISNPHEDYAKHIASWNEENREVLPHGRGYVQGNYPNFILTVFWGFPTNTRDCQPQKNTPTKCISRAVEL